MKCIDCENKCNANKVWGCRFPNEEKLNRKDLFPLDTLGKGQIEVERICQSCNETFILTTDSRYTKNERYFTFQDCPHCGERNDVWIKIKLLEEKR